MDKLYVHYGCGLCAPKEWKNFDAAFPLKIQKTPILGYLLRNQYTAYPSNVICGDIIKGLPVKDNSCDGLYCSHTLEHLALNDFRKALKNSYKILKKGGIFRCVVPDLESTAKLYVQQVNAGDKTASIKFLTDTLLGVKDRPKGFKGLLVLLFGFNQHLWMWDKYSLMEELNNAGFIDIRVCEPNDSDDEMFSMVEDSERFEEGIAIECRK